MNTHLTPKPRFVSRLTRNTLALILAGGRGSRLMQLTQWRAKPAMPFGGKFRIIDFPLSNCINSGIRRIGVLTQYMAHPLILHIQQGWGSWRPEFGEFVELLPAQQRTGASWYAGTADAIFQNIDIIRRHDPEFVLILAGDHVYKMDYGEMIAHHVKHNADMTVGCIELPTDRAQGLGIMSVNEGGWVVRFTEKPAHPESIPGREGITLGSMGIYVFNTHFLYEQLIRDHDLRTSSHDFGKDILPHIISKYRIHAYPFRDVQSGAQAYWRDVGTVDAFWEANLELIGVDPELNLYDESWPIWTYQAQLPPAKFVFDDDDRRGMAVDSMVSGGCIMSGSTIRHSLLFSNVKVHSYAQVFDSVILPNTDIARHAIVKRAVVDEGCVIPTGMTIGVDRAEDLRRFYVSENNVVLVTPEMLGQELNHVR